MNAATEEKIMLLRETAKLMYTADPSDYWVGIVDGMDGVLALIRASEHDV